MRNAIALMFLIALVGCGTLYQNTVTLTETVDAASKEYAHYFNATTVSKGFDAQVEAAHLKYRKSAGIAASALRAYKASGNKDTYLDAFLEAQKAAMSFVELLAPVISQAKSDSYANQVKKASGI